jgi:16S rRNA (guanine527-N7)-methyltransferase
MTDPSLSIKLLCGSEARGLGLTSAQVDQLAQYLSHLERWNRTINLTALPLADYPLLTLDRLIFEPLSSAVAFPAGSFRWFDFGSGGGSPAIPLRIILPAASLTMIESRSRKAAFLRDAVRVLGLSGVRVIWNRVAALQQSEAGGSVDVVTIRALRLDEQVATTVKHLLAETGLLILFGPVDWRLLSGDLAPATALSHDDVTILRRCVK